MKNKLLFLLTLTILLMTIISCGETEPGNDETGAAKTDTQSAGETQTEAETDYLESLPKDKFDGTNFRIIVQSYSRHPNFAEELTGETVNDTLYERDQNITDMYDIEISYITYQENRGDLYKAVQTSVSADSDDYDLVITSMADGINVLAPGGYLYNLKDVEYIDLFADWWSQSMYNNTQISGNLYTTSGALSLDYYYSPCILAFNQRLVENYGIEDLYTLVINGGWTIDKFSETLKGTEADLNGDGKMAAYEDQFALSLDELMGQAFYIASGGTQLEFDSGGIPQLSMDSEKNIDIMHKLISVIVDPNSVLPTEPLGVENKTKAFKDGMSVFMGYNMSGLIADLRDMEDDYGIIPLPKYTETQEKYLTYGSAWGPCGIAVPVTNSKIEMTGLIMETMAYISYTTVEPEMYNVTLKEKISRDQNSKVMLDIIYEDIIFDLNGIYNFGNTGNLLRSYIVYNKNEFVSKYESTKTTAQTALDTLINTFDKID